MGIKDSPDRPTDWTPHLAELFDAHHYTDGLGFVAARHAFQQHAGCTFRLQLERSRPRSELSRRTHRAGIPSPATDRMPMC